MKSKQIKQTNKTAFFKLLDRAARPLSQPADQTSAVASAGDCGDSKTHSNTSASAVRKRGGKSR